MEQEIKNNEPNDGENTNNFGRVIDALHNKNKLPTLRTYQGDVAEFIKQKNLSVVSIAVKEKEKKEKEKSPQPQTQARPQVQMQPKPQPKPSPSGLRQNTILLLVSLLLLAGGVVGGLYAAQVMKRPVSAPAAGQNEIIPYTGSINIAAATGESLAAELNRPYATEGVTIIKLSGADGGSLKGAKEFFGFMKVALPFTLSRNLKDPYAIGVFNQSGQASPFLIITAGDYGGAFAGMLDWEERMEEDLSFLSPQVDMTSLISTSTLLLKQERYAWKDMIVKNKDVRGLVSEKGKLKLAYTFLDKNTVLIAGNISVLKEISSIYASKAVAR